MHDDLDTELVERRSRCRRPALALAAIVATLPVATTVFGQSAPESPCCMDRWDPARAERGHWSHGAMGTMQRQRMVRHWTFMHEGVPEAYREQTNPLDANDENIAAGGRLYQSHCAMCHGMEGYGDGEAGRSLSPSPALLAHLIQMPVAVDEYLLWSISEGGQAFETAMPPFKEALSRDAIWQIVLYLRAGLPPVEAAAQP